MRSMKCESAREGSEYDAARCKCRRSVVGVEACLAESPAPFTELSRLASASAPPVGTMRPRSLLKNVVLLRTRGARARGRTRHANGEAVQLFVSTTIHTGMGGGAEDASAGTADAPSPRACRKT